MVDVQGNIIEAVKKFRDESFDIIEISANSQLKSKNNEFVFFLKPEITKNFSAIDFNGILDLVFFKFLEFDIDIKNVRMVGSSYLRQNNIIARHYEVLNKIASNAIDNVSDKGRRRFFDEYGVSFSDVAVVGAIEFLNKFPLLNPYSLDVIWKNIVTKKLISGTYCGKIQIDDQLMYLMNGFHPMQLANFYTNNSFIIVFHLTSNNNWANIRNNFIGSTNPEAASNGSLRNTLFKKRQEYRLPILSQIENGFHLSAGPVEALIELILHFSDFSKPNGYLSYTDFSYGQKLFEEFGHKNSEEILSNPNIMSREGELSVFDLTEHLDGSESIFLLKNFFQ